MTISTMVSPTASATVKNAAPAMDLASDAQISATTGFSGLLAQEMAATQCARKRGCGSRRGRERCKRSQHHVDGQT